MTTMRDDRYDWRNLHKGFIETSEKDYQLTINKINHYSALLFKIKYGLESRRDSIYETFGICLYNFWEWNTDEPDKENKLENHFDKVYKVLPTSKKVNCVEIYSLFKKYFIVSKKLNDNKRLLIRIKNRKNITLKEYRIYCKRFFSEVNKQVLEGKIFKFNNRVGHLLIERITSIPPRDRDGNLMDRKKRVNFQATKEAKDKLIAEGKRPYNKYEALECEMLKKEYDGVPYVVYLDDATFTKIVLVDSQFKNRTLMRFIPVSLRMKEKYEVLMERYKTVREVINAEELDTACKLSLIRRIDESYTIKYIRNDEGRSLYHRQYRC